MAEGRKRSTDDPSVWLVGEANPASTRDSRRAPEADEWIAAAADADGALSKRENDSSHPKSGAGSGGRAAGSEWLTVPKPSSGARPSNGKGTSRRAKPRGDRGVVRERPGMASRLRRAQRRLEAYEARSAKLESRATRLEAELNAERARRLAQVAELEAELAQLKVSRRR